MTDAERYRQQACQEQTFSPPPPPGYCGPTHQVPEPSTAWLLCIALLAAFLMRRRAAK